VAPYFCLNFIIEHIIDMKNLLNKYNRIVIPLCIFLLPTNLIAKGENLESVIQTLDRIEKDVKDLQKEVYRNNSIDSNEDSISLDNNATVFDLRIRDIENQISQLTEYVEEYVFKIDELKERIDDLMLEKSEAQMRTMSENNIEKEIDNTFVDNENQTLGSLSISGNEIAEDLNDNNLNEDILPDTNPEDQYQFAFDLLRSQKLNEAIKALEEFIAKNENHNLAGSANYWIGEIIYLNGEYKEAALTFAEAYQKYPNSTKVPDMLLRLSKSLSKIGKSEQACFTLNELISKYPDSKLLSKAKIESELLECQ